MDGIWAKMSDITINANGFLVSVSCPVVFDSLQPHGLWPTRLLCPWGFSRQEYWSGLPCPPPWDLPDSGIKPKSPVLQMDSLPPEPPGSYWCFLTLLLCIWFSEAFYDLLKCGFPYVYSAWDCRTTWMYALIASVSFGTFPALFKNIAFVLSSLLHLGFHTTYATRFAFCMWLNMYATHYDKMHMWPISIL